MGKKAVRVSGRIWREMCTVGWHGSFKCIEGLPEGATFCYASFLPEAYEPGPAVVVILIFEHPDWPEIEPGEDAPVISVVWEQIREDGKS